MNRRELLATALTTPLVASCASTLTKDSAPVFVEQPALENPGIDRSRASSILEKAGLQALVLNDPVNVRFATGDFPARTRMGVETSSFAVVPRDPRAPIIYVASEFTFYYTASDSELADYVVPFLVTGGAGGEVNEAFFFAQKDTDGELDAKEQRRRRSVTSSAPFYSSMQNAMDAALKQLDVKSGSVGYDSIIGLRLLEQSPLGLNTVFADNIIKHIRLIKTPFEISLMETASANNVAAAMDTARKIRSLGSSISVRNHFYAEASRRGNIPGFMVVNGSIAESYDEDLQEGTSVLIDCVSSYQGYLGDFGRTIFIGEPPPQMLRNVKGMVAAWNELRATMRPGQKFSEVRNRGAQILKRMGHSLDVPFNPHCVGLAHTEHPEYDLDGARADLTLESGMIISVDCPLMEVSRMGTAHLEDLTLITETGSRAIHDTDNQIIFT